MLKGNHDEIWCLTKAPDGTYITGAKDGAIKRWYPAPGLDRSKKTVPLSNGRFLYASSGKPLIGVLGDDARLSIYRTSDLEHDGLYQLPDTTESIALGNPSGLIAAGGSDGQIRIIPFNEPSNAPRRLEAHSDAIKQIEFSHNERWLATASKDKSVQVWDLQRNEKKLHIDGPNPATLSNNLAPNLLTFSGDDRYLAFPHVRNQEIEVWNIQEERRVGSIPYSVGILGGLAVFPERQELVTIGSKGYLTLRDIKTATYLVQEKSQLLGLQALGISPDKKRIAVGTSREGIRLWSSDVKNELLVIHPGKEISRLAFSPDGNSLVAATYNWHQETYDQLVLYRVPTWEEIMSIEGNAQME